MAQRIFVKVVGFTDVERHALNTMFRLSEDHEAVYTPWMPDAPEPARLALVDGDAYEGPLEAECPASREAKLIWIGDDPPDHAWRTFARPIAWPDVIDAMDELFAPPAAPPDLDFDVDFDTSGLDTVPPDTVPPELPPPRRALIACPDLDDRLYLRARLALAHMTVADDALTAAEALESVRSTAYAVAFVDARLPGQDPWALVQELQSGKSPVGTIVLLKSRPTLLERLRARVEEFALLAYPPDPLKVEALLGRVAYPKD